MLLRGWSAGEELPPEVLALARQLAALRKAEDDALMDTIIDSVIEDHAEILAGARKVKTEQIRFIRVDEVLKLHSRSLAKSGGQDGVRDQGLLESAVMAPQTGYYNSLAELAPVYAHGIVKNHPALDGNKRSATTQSRSRPRQLARSCSRFWRRSGAAFLASGALETHNTPR